MRRSGGGVMLRPRRSRGARKQDVRMVGPLRATDDAASAMICSQSERAPAVGAAHYAATAPMGAPAGSALPVGPASTSYSTAILTTIPFAA